MTHPKSIPTLPLSTRQATALYVHIPFCARRCPYCDFAVSEQRHSLEHAYIEALTVEAKHRLPPSFQARTVFIGGGTPTELSVESLKRIGHFLAPHCQNVKEFSIEANPGTLTEKKLHILKNMGVNRVSLGSQSLQNNVLKTLGRFHSSDQTRASVAMLKSHGFSNINLDLIFGVPQQRLDDLKIDLESYLALNIPHISAYGLTYEEGTPFFKQKGKGLIRPVPEELEARMFYEIHKQLTGANYRHYEISNYARPNHSCAHNRVYWRNGAYYGVGNSAASHLGGQRITNIRSIERYIKRVAQRNHGLGEKDLLDRRRKIHETAYLALRTARGLQPDVGQRDLGIDILEWFKEPIAKYLKLGLLEKFGSAIRLSEKGLPLADTIAVDFL
jgi:oxygen-independent coproporphyrinogen III oxidase